MVLLNPNKLTRKYDDQVSADIMRKTVAFFEAKGKAQLKDDDAKQVWYSDFIEFLKNEEVFSTLLTPAQVGGDDSRWDTWRNCEFNEILGFYGLCYWYVWQVTILGLGPLWMSKNEVLLKRVAKQLADGGIFAFGLSERDHGADVYSTSTKLTPQAGGGYLASGRKYYIGNGNEAATVSVFGKIEGSDDYVFFAVDPKHEKYELVRNVVPYQSYVAEFALHEYPLTEDDIISVGSEAWDAALNTVNIGKYNLGWASIGIATHAFYEALNHASTRRLYNMVVTDFPHVERMFTDAYARLTAMKLFAMRASDYMRSASAEDRRYLLYNPMVKMKVTTEGERVVDLLWDVIAAKGFEKDMYFEMAARDIRALPKLEGTVHVNIALIIKFMANYFFVPTELDEVPRRSDSADDAFLFDQGPTRGLSKIQFHDYSKAFAAWDTPNVRLFQEQIDVLKKFLATQTPTDEQRKDTDFTLEVGELFALVVYGQLILESAKLTPVSDDLIDHIFDCLVRDFSSHALTLHGKPTATSAQAELALAMIRRPQANDGRAHRVWKQDVQPIAGRYEMANSGVT